MGSSELDRLESDVKDARRRLKSDLDVLREPETFPAFKHEIVAEARQSGDELMANAKAAATGWSERLIAEIKGRAAANPVAVGAIAAGIGWHILRRPPITTMLVGYGLYSLFQTQPGHLAPGAETVYDMADTATAVKEHVDEWSGKASQAISRAQEVIAPAVREGVKSVQSIGKSAQGWAAESADRIAVTAGAVSEMRFDPQSRDKALLGFAAVALTVANRDMHLVGAR